MCTFFSIHYLVELLLFNSNSIWVNMLAALCDRLLDYDESIRQKVVAVVSDLACHELSSILPGTIKLVADRLRDKSV